MSQMFRLAALVPIAVFASMDARAAIDDATLEAATRSVMPQVVSWRRDFHQHPELSNREVRTSRLVAEQLRQMGIEVRTGIARTGVVGLLKGGKPGPTIALRADMDALPVTEQVDVPFKSVATAEYRGEKVGVMHACGHDAHTAMLLGTARILAGMRDELPGTVMFVFQPAEEGPPDGERGGAPLMLEEGLFATTRPEAMFGLHVFSTVPVGKVGFRPGPFMAASDSFRLVVHGRQTHGARPWGGVDPIVTASQIVTSLQTIVARQVDITKYPAVVTVGAIKGGIRFNIVPDSVELAGTIRTFDPEVRKDVLASVERIARDTASAAGATVDFELGAAPNPALHNDPGLTKRAVTSLERVLGGDNVEVMPFVTVSEDFAHFALEVPSFYWFVGSTTQGQDPATAPSNHSSQFFLDEASLPIGVKSLTAVAVDYLQGR